MWFISHLEDVAIIGCNIGWKTTFFGDLEIGTWCRNVDETTSVFRPLLWLWSNRHFITDLLGIYNNSEASSVWKLLLTGSNVLGFVSCLDLDGIPCCKWDFDTDSVVFTTGLWRCFVVGSNIAVIIPDLDVSTCWRWLINNTVVCRGVQCWADHSGWGQGHHGGKSMLLLTVSVPSSLVFVSYCAKRRIWSS